MRAIRFAQLLLVLAAGGLWVASRLTWVSLQSFDELGPPKTSTLDGAAWSSALLPMALLLIAAALAALAVRGWVLRVVALLVAAVCLAVGYLGASLLVMPDVAPRGAALADVPVALLVSSDRHSAGAVVTLVSAVFALVAAALLMRAGSVAEQSAVKYGARPAEGTPSVGDVSERGMWEALDAGRDPTERDAGGSDGPSGAEAR